MDWEGEREIEKSEVGRDEERLRENGRWTERGRGRILPAAAMIGKEAKSTTVSGQHK